VSHSKHTACFFRDIIDAYYKNHTKLNYTVSAKSGVLNVEVGGTYN
jgi:hypothetical protein